MEPFLRLLVDLAYINYPEQMNVMTVDYVKRFAPLKKPLVIVKKEKAIIATDVLKFVLTMQLK